MGQVLPREQLDDMGRRLHVVATREPPLRQRFEVEEIKFRLLAFVVTVETNLRKWTVKYGYQPEVEVMLSDYHNFVDSQQLFQRYDATYISAQERSDAFRRMGDQGGFKQYIPKIVYMIQNTGKSNTAFFTLDYLCGGIDDSNFC